MTAGLQRLGFGSPDGRAHRPRPPSPPLALRDAALAVLGGAAQPGDEPLGAPPAPAALGARGRARKIDSATYDLIRRRFTTEVQAAVGDQFLFAFICGSVARQNATETHDIDTFVCVRAVTDEQRQRYFHWVGRLHEDARMTVDTAFPAEYVDLATLEEKFSCLSQVRIDPDFIDSEMFDTVTWAEMVSPASAQAHFVGDQAPFRRLRHTVEPWIPRWRQGLLQRLRDDGANIAGLQEFIAPNPDMTWENGVELLQELSLPRIMRRVVCMPEEPLDRPQAAIEEALTNLPRLLTARLDLRPLRQEDAAAVYSWARDPRVAHFCSWEPMTSADQAEAFVAGQRRRAAAGEVNDYALHLRGSDSAVIGTCGLKTLGLNEGGPGRHQGELAFALAQPFWGLKLMAEAAARVIKFFEGLGLERITLSCEVPHTRCQGLASRLGFVPVDRHWERQVDGVDIELLDFERLPNPRQHFQELYR